METSNYRHKSLYTLVLRTQLNLSQIMESSKRLELQGFYCIKKLKQNMLKNSRGGSLSGILSLYHCTSVSQTNCIVFVISLSSSPVLMIIAFVIINERGTKHRIVHNERMFVTFRSPAYEQRFFSSDIAFVRMSLPFLFFSPLTLSVLFAKCNLKSLFNYRYDCSVKQARPLH